jgi:iron(III) transport system substrate-binding protein
VNNRSTAKTPRRQEYFFISWRLGVLAVPFVFFFLTGCNRSPSREIVLYTSVDEPIASPIVRDFEKETGIHVHLVTDTEATKSVGLAERLRAEKSNPQADVWWGNEPFYTIGLAEDGLLQPYNSPSAVDVNQVYKDPQHRWTGNGLRMRVIAVSGGVGSNHIPASIEELTSAHLGLRIAMAMPTAGTTGGHVAALYYRWGNERADKFFHDLRANGIKLLGGNSDVAEAVARGTIDWGLTDNDDVEEARQFISEKDRFLEAIPLDQKDFGTLMIPTTVGLVKDSPQAKQLIDYLLSPQIEDQLSNAKFIVESARGRSGIKAMKIDYEAVAKILPQAVQRATAIMQGRDETR